MKHAIKEKIRNKYVHGYLNEEGYRVMPTLDEMIRKYNVPASSTNHNISSPHGIVYCLLIVPDCLCFSTCPGSAVVNCPF